MMNFASEIMNSAFKMMTFVLGWRYLIVQLPVGEGVNFVLKMMNSVVKMMHSVGKNDRFCIENDEFCIQNDGF